MADPTGEWKHAYDCVGHETNQEGVPYRELFSQAEIERLGFEVFRLYTSFENRDADMQPDPTTSVRTQRVLRSRNGFRVAENIVVVEGLELRTEIEVTEPLEMPADDIIPGWQEWASGLNEHNRRPYSHPNPGNPDDDPDDDPPAAAAAA